MSDTCYLKPFYGFGSFIERVTDLFHDCINDFGKFEGVVSRRSEPAADRTPAVLDGNLR